MPGNTGIFVLHKMFTPGRIIFVAVFVLAFVGGLVWSYKKDGAVNRVHFKKPWLVLIGIIFFLTILFLIVKMRKFL